jgi:hypothetical protein
MDGKQPQYSVLLVDDDELTVTALARLLKSEVTTSTLPRIAATRCGPP